MFSTFCMMKTLSTKTFFLQRHNAKTLPQTPDYLEKNMSSLVMGGIMTPTSWYWMIYELWQVGMDMHVMQEIGMAVYVL